MMLGDVSVIDPPFLVFLGIATAVVFVASWLPAKQRWIRYSVRGVGVVLTVLVTAAAINTRYEYLPTLSSLLGRRAADQVSEARLRELEAGALDNSASGRLALARSEGGPNGSISRGVVVPFVIPGTKSHVHARTGQIYLPPAFFRDPHRRLPVIELLHGEPGSPSDWTRGAYVDVTADSYAAQHHGFAPILVMPDTNGGWLRDSECVNGKFGQVQTYLTVDVRNAVVKRFHALSSARNWAIAGLSEGGYCALQIGLRNPDLFGTIADYSGEAGPSTGGGLNRLFSGSPSRVAAQAAAYNPVDILQNWNSTSPKPAIWFDDGTQDSTLPQIALVDSLAQHQGFQTHLSLRSGPNHSFGFWGQAFAGSLPWMIARVTNSQRLAGMLASDEPAAG